MYVTSLLLNECALSEFLESDDSVRMDAGMLYFELWTSSISGLSALSINALKQYLNEFFSTSCMCTLCCWVNVTLACAALSGICASSVCLFNRYSLMHLQKRREKLHTFVYLAVLQDHCRSIIVS